MPKVEGIASVNIDRYVHLLMQLLEYVIKGYTVFIGLTALGAY